MDRIKIGWAGLGNMGKPMVKNLIKAGYEVRVYNRTLAKAIALQKEEQVSVAAKASELADGTDFIITMLSDDDAVKGLYGGKDGIAEVDLGKNIIGIDMSTVSPRTTKEIASLYTQKGSHYLDAPVSGSVKQAVEKQLLIMVGGREEDYQKAKPVFDILGKESVYIGESGKGNYIKLAINLYLGIITQGLSEAVVFAEKNGLNPKVLLGLINNGTAASIFTKIKTENIVNDNFNPAFALKHMAKDIRLAKEEGMNSPAGNAVYLTAKQALDHGLGEEDMIAIVKFLRESGMM